MDVTLSSAPLRGTVRAMSSKSQAHRLMICTALANRPTELLCPDTSADMEATAACLRALGADIRRAGDVLHITPLQTPPKQAILDCGESGSTLRFLLPLAGALGVDATFCLHGRLPARPLSPLWEELEGHGCRLSRPSTDRLRCQGKLQPGHFQLAGNISSQFISGLLLALPLLDGPSDIMLTTSLESAGYVRLTLDAMAAFGAPVETRVHGWHIDRHGYTSPGRATVEGDWSNAAFWLCAGAVSGPMCVTGLQADSAQGDRAILQILADFGARITWSGDAVTVTPGPLRPLNLDVRDIPDLVPPLALVAACAPGTSCILGAERLRIKESDRMESVAATIGTLGARAEVFPGGLRILGGALTGGQVDSQNDHRIAMLGGIASARCPVCITGAEAVKKSYPNFWQELSLLRKEERS